MIIGELIALELLMIAIGSFIYITKYKNKENPKSGIKREKMSEYFDDYMKLKLYWTSIAFVFVGSALLLATIFILFF